MSVNSRLIVTQREKCSQTYPIVFVGFYIFSKNQPKTPFIELESLISSTNRPIVFLLSPLVAKSSTALSFPL